MESNNQPPQNKITNVPTVSDSNAAEDSSPPAEDVQLRSIKQNEHKTNHVQHKTTAQENHAETTTIKSPDVGKVDKILYNDEEKMDISGGSDHFEEDDSAAPEQVGLSTKPQTESKPQNEYETESSEADVDDDDENMTNTEEEIKYKTLQETQEEDLLKSDHEDDSNGSKNEIENKSTAKISDITLEQEEELLKSDDEEEAKKKYTTEEEKRHEVSTEKYIATIRTNEMNCSKEQKTNEPEHKIKLDICTYNSKTDGKDANDPIDSRDQHHEEKLAKESFNSEALSQENDQKYFNHKLEHYSLESPSAVNKILKKNQAKAKGNAENHRILYQFDLDDDSSSQESYHSKNSPPLQEENEIKLENCEEGKSIIQLQYPQKVPEMTATQNSVIEKEFSSKEDANKPFSQFHQSDLLDSDSSVSDNEADVLSISTAKFNSKRAEEASCDSDLRQNKYPSTPCSPKVETSISDEDISVEQNVNNLNETGESFSMLTTSRNYKEEKQTGSSHDSLSNNNDSFSNDRDFQDTNESKSITQSLKLNGDHNNETAQSEDATDANLKNAKEVSPSRKSSIEHSFTTAIPQQQSLKDIVQDESTQSSFHNDLLGENAACPAVSDRNDDNENQMETGSDNESSLKNDEKIDVYQNENSNENVYVNKSSFSLSPPLKTPNDEEEASRSSLASSVSYSSDTSSSQHLVIDHPMDDIKEEKVKPLKISLKRKLSFSSDDDASTGLQRKHFHFNDENEAQENSQNSCNKEDDNEKQPEVSSLYVPHNDNTNQSERDCRIYENPQKEQEAQIKLSLEKKEEKSSDDSQKPYSAETPLCKSLLLQQLEKPLAMPNMAPSYTTAPATFTSTTLPLSTQPVLAMSDLPASFPSQTLIAQAALPPPTQAVIISQDHLVPSQPLTLVPTNLAPQTLHTMSSHNLPIPPPPPPLPPAVLFPSSLPSQTQPILFTQALSVPPPPPSTGDTKYLCFKCKTGAFDSFAALTEHQTVCLASHNLFPFNPMPKQASHPAQNLLPSIASNPKDANASTPTQLDALPGQIETTTPPPQTAALSTKKRYYKCSTCHTFHENWNLFLHIREKHDRHLCLYCIRFFPTAEKLALHLEIKHDLEQNHFNSEEALRNSIRTVEHHALESRFLMCCTCQHVFVENEQFSQHDCSELIKPCSLCGQKGRHTNQCKAHPDSKRFSKLKKKKEKQILPSINIPPARSVGESNNKDLTVPPITINNHNINPTIISNSNFNCDSGRAEKQQRPPTFNSMHNEDSNSSSNMVIDESCNISHLPVAQTQPQESLSLNVNLGLPSQTPKERLEPDLPPDRPLPENKSEVVAALPPLKLVVPKFKLRVPKEFQKSVDDALTTSDSEEEVDEDEDEEVEEGEEHKKESERLNESAPAFTTAFEADHAKHSAAEATQNSLLAESTPANSQDMEMEHNSTTASANEAGNSQNGAADKNTSQKPSLSLDDDDSLDEPNSNLVRIMQEIERTKLDIQRTKKTSIRHNKTFALPRQPTISQSSNRTADHNWSPTPPASPNSRWFTPRRSTLSQSGEELLQKTPQHQQCLLPPPSPIKDLRLTQERRDTIGSDMMDIDETITSQPTQTIYRNQLRDTANGEINTPSEISGDKTCAEPMECSQINENETGQNSNSNPMLDGDKYGKSETIPLTEPALKPTPNIEEMSAKEGNSPQTPDKMETSLTQSTDNENEEQKDVITKQAEEEDEAEDTEIDVCDSKEQEEQIRVTDSESPLEEKSTITDGIEVANEDAVVVDMKLDKPLDKYEVIDFVRICLKWVYPLCLYCNHARRIAVNGKSLVLHMVAQHRFTATVDSITAEELLPATIVTKLKSFLPELEEHYFNSNSYCTYGDGAFTHHFNERIFECFQCRFVTSTHKELYLHNRKMHLRTAILCFMCRANFFSFSEILCHICPGVPNKLSVFDVKFRCCLCELDNIPSPFRLMVHLRKKHFACDVCLEDCRDQSKLSSHVWKHKLHHLCYRCGIAYRNKLDITKHLFWKHGTESTLCKRCLQKRWRHVYHFCIPPTTFVCEVCNLCFSKAMYLRVHKRLHSGDLRYPCIEDNCEEKFISRKLLLKHALVHQEQSAETEKDKNSDTALENKENEPGAAKDEDGDDLKKPADLQVKQELIEIKKEPLDETEMQNLSSEKSAALVDKKETAEEKVKVCENAEVKDKKRLDAGEPRKKRKKSKRSKELLEDLNLAAPNLSESDSSDDSDTDSDARTKSELEALPRVMLSPPSEAENEDKEDKTMELVEPGQVLEIWKNFLQTQQGSSTAEELERLKAISEEQKAPKRIPVHVACSDHDYCKLEPDPPDPTPTPGSEAIVEAPKDDFKKPAAEIASTPETSPTKRKQSKSPRRSSSKRSDGSSSSSNSSSSSDSSCSCGSNCSCSSSGSNSSSSSSSSDDSDSTMASNNSLRKRHRKKSERDRMHKRSESMSPLKQHKHSGSINEVVQVDDEDNGNENDNFSERPPSPPKEPLIYESDLETNESETDEEFYDEHPQKLANELLAQKRAQLMAQTRLSPSHNFDIVENSRPSTPSLPEEMATNEKPKIKVKKKKRDRKSSCKGQNLHSTHGAATDQSMAPAQIGLDVQQLGNSIMQAASQQIAAPVATRLNSTIPYNIPGNVMTHAIYAPPPPAVLAEHTGLTPRPITMPPYGSFNRLSEGSSCSDADGSLKRSKRQRRPNKFYGYTSDDENLINGPPLMIGTRAFKPQPPPQLTWCKDDLPTPSKSILNNKNKAPRAPKTPAIPDNPFASTFGTSAGKKKTKLSLTGADKSARKRPAKKKDAKTENKFPPIPTLKIRSSQIGLNTTINHSIDNNSGNYNTTDDTSSDEEATKEYFTPSAGLNSQVVVAAPPIVLPSQPPAPPTPHTTAFNHRIPPALLPNPDFPTLQYFKANNIRYPIRPPAGARQPREGESVYCYCRCPYDEVSEMIACDGENCLIEWFHFECVGIMVAPQGKWFCAECRPKYSEELYPSTAAGQLGNV